ncbi:hypothetical protein KTJ62_16435 [Acinetobacter sp. WU_MDCI_Abxa265]|nr:MULTISPECIES: hypothetical protein [Acinetobacter]MCU4637960.1 hypothetical protein [Acinetobacter sp. WU_MDCI_Abxa265]
MSSDAMNQAVIAEWKEGNFKLTGKMIKLNIQRLEVSRTPDQYRTQHQF